MIMKRELDIPDYVSENAIDMISKMLNVNSRDRLGAPGSKYGIKGLMNHQFFEGINFKDFQSLMLPQDLINETWGLSGAKNWELTFQQPIRSNTQMVMGKNLTAVVCKGFLLKKNRWFNKQLRFFNLYENGELRYYKDFYNFKGKIILTKDTKVLKTGKKQLEIPTNKKTFILVESEKKDQLELPISADPLNENQLFTNDIDQWIEALNNAISKL